MDDLDLIPLTPIQRALPDEKPALRAALLQVLTDLVIARVPEGERLPLFGKAYELLLQAGWGLDELCEATEPGPRQQQLFEVLGL